MNRQDLCSLENNQPNNSCQDSVTSNNIGCDSTPHATRESEANQAGSLFSPLKPAATIDEQISKLASHGIFVAQDDFDFARDTLAQNNYYRLSGYWFLLEDENQEMPKGITLKDIITISQFDSNLRQWLFRAIEPIEIMARTQFAYVLATMHGPNAIEDESFFKDESAYKTSLKNIHRDVERAKKDKQPCVVHNLSKYGKLPIWALVEVMTMGEISKLYGNLADESAAIEISKAFGLKPLYLKSWLEHLTMVRNLCAHHNRVVGKLMTKKPRLYKRDKQYKNFRLFPTLLVLEGIYCNIWPQKWNELLEELSTAIEQCPHVSLDLLGLPYNWEQLLVINDNKAEGLGD